MSFPACERLVQPVHCRLWQPSRVCVPKHTSLLFPPSVEIRVSVSQALENLVFQRHTMRGHFLNKGKSKRQSPKRGLQPLNSVDDDKYPVGKSDLFTSSAGVNAQVLRYEEINRSNV